MTGSSNDPRAFCECTRQGNAAAAPAKKGRGMAAFANLMMLTGAWFPEDDVETKVRLETSESGCSKGLRKDYERITGSGNESD